MNSHILPQRLLLLGIRHRRTTQFSGAQVGSQRTLHDARFRYSNFWIPPLQKGADKLLDTNKLLERAGFLQQAYSGIFHLLPLGLRVQDKLERLVDKHMRSLGASKLSLSSISAQDLWERSGRLGSGSELFKFSDRKEARWLLSPTHEEEITTLVSSLAQSYRDLPIRVYQISRKYRDELRPRQGLLRGREFLMKDLYTFDVDPHQGMITYDAVRKAYTSFFDELKVPYVVAKADSGNMGGNLSHEYHLPSSKGEDDIISCLSCDYTRNEELVESMEYSHTVVPHDTIAERATPHGKGKLVEFTAVTDDKKTLVKAYTLAGGFGEENIKSPRRINPYAVKAAVPQVDLGHEDPQAQFKADLLERPNVAEEVKSPYSVMYLFDYRVNKEDVWRKLRQEYEFVKTSRLDVTLVEAKSNEPMDLTRAESGDYCPACHQGQLKVQKAIEVGHTFYLGTRYSERLGAIVALNVNHQQQETAHTAPMQMGCHGIGVSRLIAAVAASLSEKKGLRWPRVMAPFQVVIIPPRATHDSTEVTTLYDQLTTQMETAERSNPEAAQHLAIDAIVDDRGDKDLIWKLRDADLIGYPLIVLFGRQWEQGHRKVEIQCHQAGFCDNVPVDEAPSVVKGLLEKL